MRIYEYTCLEDERMVVPTNEDCVNHDCDVEHIGRRRNAMTRGEDHVMANVTEACTTHLEEAAILAANAPQGY